MGHVKHPGTPLPSRSVDSYWALTGMGRVILVLMGPQDGYSMLFLAWLSHLVFAVMVNTFDPEPFYFTGKTHPIYLELAHEI